MDYLTIGLAVLAAILLIIALVQLYGAKASNTSDTRNRNRTRVFGMYLSGDVPNELYNPNKINSGMYLTWAALVFAVLAAVSAAVKKVPLAKRGLNYLSTTARGYLTGNGGLTVTPANGL